MSVHSEDVPFGALLALANGGWEFVWSVATPTIRGYGPEVGSRPVRLDLGAVPARRPDVLDPADTTDPRWPRTARALARHGLTSGWAVRVTFVAGNALLKAQRPGLRIAATWEDGAFDGAWLLAGRTYPVPLGVPEVRAFLKGVA